MTGCRAYDGEYVEVWEAILTAKPRPLSELRTGVPEGLVAIVDRCLAKRPGDRYANIDELMVALKPFASSDTYLDTRDDRVSAAPDGRRGRRNVFALATLAAVIIVAPPTLRTSSHDVVADHAATVALTRPAPAASPLSPPSPVPKPSNVGMARRLRSSDAPSPRLDEPRQAAPRAKRPSPSRTTEAVATVDPLDTRNFGGRF